MYYALLFSIFRSICLCAQITTPLSIELTPGYREESVDVRLQNSLEGSPFLYAEDYRHLGFFGSEFRLDKIYRGMYLSFHTALASIGNGDLTQSYVPFLGEDSSTFTFKVRSSLISDTQIRFGFVTNLTPHRFYKVIVGPYVGFLYLYETLQRKGTPAHSETGSSFLQENFRLSRWGIFLGPLLEIYPCRRLHIASLYGYAFLSQKHTLRSTFILEPSSIKIQNSLPVRLHGTHAQIGELSICGEIAPALFLGVSSGVTYFFTGFREASNQRIQENILTGAKTKTNERVTYRMRETSFQIGCKLDWRL